MFITAQKVFFRIGQVLASLALTLPVIPTAAGMVWVAAAFLRHAPAEPVTFLQGLFASVFAGGALVLVVGILFAADAILHLNLPRRIVLAERAARHRANKRALSTRVAQALA